jgi:hypothetical protein
MQNFFRDNVGDIIFMEKQLLNFRLSRILQRLFIFLLNFTYSSRADAVEN